MNRFRALWKWPAVVGLIGAIGIALLMAEPRDVPLLVFLSDALPDL